MADKGRTLIFFTDTFPCGKGEAFIENEFPILAAAFDKVIVVTNNLTDEATRPVPKNVKVTRLAYTASTFYKVIALGGVLESFITKEFGFIRKTLKLRLNRQTLSILFSSYAKALETDVYLGNLIKQEGIDETNLYLYSYWMNDMAVALAYFKYKQPKVKAFCRAHGWDVYFERHNPPYLPLRNFITQQLDNCFCISDNGAAYINAKTGNALSNKIKVSRLGTINKSSELNAGSLSTLLLVSCSNIIPLKRLHLIVEALSLIDGIEINWVHFGSGALQQEIQTLATTKLGSKGNIKFEFKGQVSNTQLLAYYKLQPVDLFINVSETEGVPVSIMEAYSYGVPAIATNVGGVPELVNELNGFLLDVNCSAKTIADTISKYYNSAVAEKQKMRLNAFNTWDTKFNAEKNYSQFVKYITQL
jgi:glycosyltransferase involved in cell wall biosynthesis